MLGIEVVPSAKRLIKSARDLAYDLPTTVAYIGHQLDRGGHKMPSALRTLLVYDDPEMEQVPASKSTDHGDIALKI